MTLLLLNAMKSVSVRQTSRQYVRSVLAQRRIKRALLVGHNPHVQGAEAYSSHVCCTGEKGIGKCSYSFSRLLLTVVTRFQIRIQGSRRRAYLLYGVYI